MSFLKEIEYRKKLLRSCDTKVTTPDGNVYKECRLPDGSVNITCSGMSKSPGFVIDTKPDLEVAVVLPGLCMGSQDVTQDLSLLEKYEVTHILSVGIDIDKISDNISYKYIEILDVPESNLISILEECISYINAVRASGCVYVHCNAGVSRSASVVIAYLMSTGMSYNDAYTFLQSKRNVIKPNEGFVRQLRTFENSLRQT